MSLYATLRTDAEAAADQQRQQWPADFGPRGDVPRIGPHPWADFEYAMRFETRPGLHLVDTSDAGAAHVCSGITSDSDADDDKRGPMTRGELLALACVMLVAWLALLAGVSVAWMQWFGA